MSIALFWGKGLFAFVALHFAVRAFSAREFVSLQRFSGLAYSSTILVFAFNSEFTDQIRYISGDLLKLRRSLMVARRAFVLNKKQVRDANLAEVCATVFA